jgi:hypothetical protein
MWKNLEFVNTYLPRCTTVCLVSIEKEKEIVYGVRERERERERERDCLWREFKKCGSYTVIWK